MEIDCYFAQFFFILKHNSMKMKHVPHAVMCQKKTLSLIKNTFLFLFFPRRRQIKTWKKLKHRMNKNSIKHRKLKK